MRRREFITLLSSAAAAWPLSTLAQGRTFRLGSLHQSPRDAPHHVAFFDELQRLGFVEGKKTFLAMSTAMDCTSKSLGNMHRSSSNPKSM